MTGLNSKTGDAKPTRAERSAVNKAAAAQRHADWEAGKAERRANLPPDCIGRAPGRAGAGARAQEGREHHTSAASGRPGADAVVLADHGMTARAEAVGLDQTTDEKRQAVVIMRANSFTKKAIGAVLGIDEAALDRDYAFEIEHGFALVATKLTSAVTLSALNGDQKDRQFWLRSKLGWGGDRAVTITAGVMEAQMSPNATKPWPGGGLPAPNADGKIVITMRLGIPLDKIEDDDDGC